jgi:mannose-6-phosphate isomerase-like protein (cupin superfamily)
VESHGIDVTNIDKATEWFEVLHTHERAQTAMMTLAGGKATGGRAEAHPHSDQVLLVLEGELDGEVGPDRLRLRKGDVIVIPGRCEASIRQPGRQISRDL